MDTLVQPPSSKRRAKFALGGLAVIAIVVGLIVWAMTRPGATAFYLTVSEVRAEAPTTNQDFRVNGNVVPGTLEQDGTTTSFAITDGVEQLDIVTEESLPDAFSTAYANDPSAVEIVAQGNYDGDTFVAHQVLAKCPSKFKAKA
ncbi:MAG: cytochrome c maturation protein CcmE [Actinomycetota bacterium]|nr:cytochrome c maturation protein CcmE [Actinomycetota bacterium]